MCSRYYVNEEVMKELAVLTCEADEELRAQLGAFSGTADVSPSQSAVLVLGQAGTLTVKRMRWGFPQQSGRGLLINARAETAAEKASFRDSVRYGRCAVPAAGFYEWNRNKEKAVFTRENEPVFYMAGLWRQFDGEARFVILTTKANASVAPVHERMPLLLTREEMEAWICDGGRTGDLLEKTPEPLKREQEYEQIRLFL